MVRVARDLRHSCLPPLRPGLERSMTMFCLPAATNFGMPFRALYSTPSKFQGKGATDSGWPIRNDDAKSKPHIRRTNKHVIFACKNPSLRFRE